DDILYLCNLSIMDKVNIYNRALFFIDLSFYEDVNIDIIEAFACNTPIVCSDISLYKEYFGDLAFYYNGNEGALLEFVYNSNIYNKEFVMDKFKSDISLKSSLNIYDKFT
ncbi:MAG: glycosyltransferase, partial [Romboutsia sp.]|uniref:glycosyltransferase n=1 Tax=Romboutsia sp. TaxID=1965302 RepID=UPI003F3F37A4